MQLTAIIISIISLITSVITFIYNWYCNKLNLKIDVTRCYLTNDNQNSSLLIECHISNKSRNFISIDNVCLEKAKCYDAIRQEIVLGSIGTVILNQECNQDFKTTILPIKLNSYDSINASFIIPIFDEVVINNTEKIIFKTSRGLIIRNQTINKDNY